MTLFKSLSYKKQYVEMIACAVFLYYHFYEEHYIISSPPVPFEKLITPPAPTTPVCLL